MEGWIIKLHPKIYFGPPPRKQGDVAYLIDTLGISYIVDMCDTVSYEKSYKKHLPEDVLVIEMKAPSKAKEYPVWIKKLATKFVNNECICYLFGRNGNDEEAYGAFCLEAHWYGTIEDPIKWIKENQYDNRIFDDDAEKKDILVECVRQVRRARANPFMLANKKTK